MIELRVAGGLRPPCGRSATTVAPFPAPSDAPVDGSAVRSRSLIGWVGTRLRAAAPEVARRAVRTPQEASIGPDGRALPPGRAPDQERGRVTAGGGARGTSARAASATREARPGPDRERPAPGPHSGAPEAARVPGRRPYRRPDRRRLHGPSRRPERPLRDPAGAVRRGDRRARAHVRGPGRQGAADGRAV